MTLNKLVIGPDNIVTTVPASIGDLISPTTLLNDQAAIVRAGLYAAIILMLR